MLANLAAIRPPWPQQSKVEDVQSVGEAEQDDAGPGLEAVRLGEKLVERVPFFQVRGVAPDLSAALRTGDTPLAPHTEHLQSVMWSGLSCWSLSQSGRHLISHMQTSSLARREARSRWPLMSPYFLVAASSLALAGCWPSLQRNHLVRSSFKDSVKRSVSKGEYTIRTYTNTKKKSLSFWTLMRIKNGQKQY